MEWVEDTGEEHEQEGLKGAFELLHDAPAALTARQAKSAAGKQAAAAEAQAARALTLDAFHPLFDGEPEAQRLARADAAERCWGEFAAHIKATLDTADAGVFQGLLDLARQAHAAAAAAAADAAAAAEAGAELFELQAGCQPVPAGLVLAGGVNSADHAHTFPRLAGYLRQHGCYVALLRPASFGRAPGEALGEALRQMSGLRDSRAEDMEALAAWYAEETGGGLGAAAPVGQQQQQRQQRRRQQEEEDESSDDEEADEDAAGLSQQQQQEEQQEGRRLRQRPAAGAAAGPSPAQLAARERPLVVVVEGTEGVDPLCLRDFILMASRSHREVPLTLVLGLTTTAAALGGLLPSEVVDRCLAPRHFKLAPAMERLDSLVQQVLLGGSGRWPGLLFSSAIVGQLTDLFLNHYFSTGCIAQGLREAAWAHFRCQPAAFLAAAALEGRRGVEAALEGLDKATLAELRRVLGGRTPAQLADAVLEAQAGWSRWAVGVQWLVQAAEAVGLRSQEFRPWKLLEEALRSDFCSTQLKPLLSRLQPLLRKLPPAAARQLAAGMRARAEVVWGGAEAAAEQLAQLAALEAEATEEGAAATAAGADDAQPAQERQQTAAEAAEQPQQQQTEEEQPAKKKQKRDVTHSKASRLKALLDKSAAAAAAKGAPSAAAAAAARREREAAAPGARLAAWLAPALRALLGTLPTKLPGAAAFTCRDLSSLDCLTAVPRAALHLALSEPHRFLPGLPEGLGLSGGQEDAVLAYRLFDQDAACANLPTWFESFEAVHTAAADQAAAGPSDGGSGKKKKAAVKKAKRKGGGEQGAAAAGGGGEAKRRRRELAARFSHATAELQYIGFIKPSKRRRGDYVQRTVHMPAAGL